MTQDSIKKKLNDLDAKLSKLTISHHSLIMALITILQEEGVLKDDRFRELANKYKKLLRDVDEHAEFIKMMRQIKRKKK